MSPADTRPNQASPIYIGIDMGTSGVRICAIDQQANCLHTASQPVPDSTIQGQHVSQHPSDWLKVVDQVMHTLCEQINPRQVAAIAVDGTSGTVLLTDNQQTPLTEALMYNDARASEQVQQLAALAPDDSPVHSVHAGLPKLLWLDQQSTPRTVSHAMHQADWISSYFSQRPGHSDVNNCLKTGYDPIQHRWPDWVGQLTPLCHWLPQVHPPGTSLGPIAQNIAEQYGFPYETQIIAGTTDSHAATLATGAQLPGEAVTSLGSTLVMKVISEKPIFNKTYGIHSQPYGDYWLVGGSSNAGGAVLRHFFSDERMASLSTQIDPSIDTGLNYYPLLTPGERFPINDPRWPAKLTPRPDHDVDFFQGLLEGLSQIEYNGYQRLTELGAPYPTKVYSIGGGSMNQAWQTIRARYLKTVVTTSQHNDAAYGTARLAQQGATA